MVNRTVVKKLVRNSIEAAVLFKCICNMKKDKKRKHFLTWILILSLVITVMPAHAFVSESEISLTEEVKLTDVNGQTYEAVENTSIKSIIVEGEKVVIAKKCYVVDVPKEIDLKIESNLSNEWYEFYNGTKIANNELPWNKWILGNRKNDEQYNTGQTLCANDDGKEIQLFIVTDKNSTSGNVDYAVILRVGAVASIAVDKTVLDEQINVAEALMEESYYNSGDNFNGLEYSKEGFWSDFKGALNKAKWTKENSNNTKDITEAASKPEACNAKLNKTRKCKSYKTLRSYEKI